MEFGITNTSYEFHSGGNIFTNLMQKAQWSEENGFSWFSVMDHFIQISGIGPMTDPVLESWTTLAALAATTSRIRLGTLVSSVGYRNPALLAKMAATVDMISQGRLTLGIGAGWFQEEYAQYGFEYPEKPSIRIAQMEEAIEIIRQMWTAERANFEGEYFTIHDALLEPKPLQKPPPIMIGGEGPKFTLNVVARLADSSNVFGDPQSAKRKFDTLRSHCEKVGRDFEAIERTVISSCLVAKSESALSEKIEDYGIQDWVHALTIPQAVELFRRYEAVGVDLLILSIHKNDPETLEFLASEILPSFKEV